MIAEVRQTGETNKNKGSDEYLTHVLVGNRNFLENPRRVRQTTFKKTLKILIKIAFFWKKTETWKNNGKRVKRKKTKVAKKTLRTETKSSDKSKRYPRYGKRTKKGKTKIAKKSRRKKKKTDFFPNGAKRQKKPKKAKRNFLKNQRQARQKSRRAAAPYLEGARKKLEKYDFWRVEKKESHQGKLQQQVIPRGGIL